MAPVFTAREHIDRSVADVWAALTDWNNAPRWMPGVENLQAHGETANGTLLTFRARGKERPASIAAYEPGRSLVLRSVQGKVTADYTYVLQECPGGRTLVTLVAECRAGGLLWRAAFPLLRFAMKRVDGNQLSNLKNYMEAR
ncbi:SRPBCC family protein [Nitratireductor sp. XY-223]|uniref:SRPBCC family protein n=1 Tax=Nitratireductor sp. XY-223 TaxID=2561926 RepID=UPI0010AA7365|nr:SRPBCC family protein [Nitratireductor sp. XY-223]